jgi:formylglycine-generating enzyme required for sulfatase activity
MAVDLVVSADLPQKQSIDWSSPILEELLVVGSATPLQASASSGLPVTFRVIEGPASLDFSLDPGSNVKSPYILSTNPGSIKVVAEQSGGIIGGIKYSAISVEREFNQTPLAELLSILDISWLGFNLGPECVCQYPNIIKNFCADKTNVYLVLTREGVWVRGPTGPPKRVQPFDNSVEDLKVVNNIAYAAIGERGIRIVDLSRPQGLELLTEYRLAGKATRMTLNRNLACVVMGDKGVQIIDVGNPTAPILKGALTNGGRALLVEIEGNRAYVATSLSTTNSPFQGGVQIYDITNVAVPVHLGSYPITGSPTAMRVDGLRVFLADSKEGLQIIDASNPQTPIVMSRRKVGNCTDIEVVGGYAYFACGPEGVFLLDLKEIDTFKFGQNFKLTEKLFWPGGWFPSQSKVYDIAIAGNQLLLGSDRTFSVVRLSGSSRQQLTIDLPTSVELGSSVLGFRAVSSSGLPVSVKVKSGPAIIDGNHLVLKDLGTVFLEFSQTGDPTYAPVSEERTLEVTTKKQLQDISWRGPTVTNLYPRRPYPLQAVSSSGLPVSFRVESGPAYLREGSLYVTGSGSIAVLAEQVGNHQFERTSSAKTFFGSNLMFPSEHPATRLGGKAVKVVVQGKLAVVMKDNFEVSIIDVGDPTNPKLIANKPIGDTRDFEFDHKRWYLGDDRVFPKLENQPQAQSIKVNGNLLYVAYKNQPIKIFDLMKYPTVYRGNIDIRPSVFDVVEDKLYAVSQNPKNPWNVEFLSIDVSNPTNPRRLASLQIIDGMNGVTDPKSICVSGKKVYFSATFDSNGGGGIIQIDVSNPSQPLVARFLTVGVLHSQVGGIQVAGDRLFLAHKAGVSVFDLKEPLTGLVIAHYPTVGTPMDLKVDQEFIYVADGVGGLQIISLDPLVLRYPGFVESDRFRFSLFGSSLSNILIESSSDLKNWVAEAFSKNMPSRQISMPVGENARYFRASKPPEGYVWIQPGKFLMGSPPEELGRRNDELQHEVTLTRGFWMAEHEVTASEFASVMGSNQTIDDRPIYVTWDQAVNYCKELTKRHRIESKITSQQTYRLPTEAEWEYAARAGTTGPRYAETNRFGERWKEVDVFVKSVVLGSDNPWGLYDMLSNVGEWCSDWYAVYSAGSQTDPTGPDLGSGYSRVIRGTGDGEWSSDDGQPTFRSAERSRDLGYGAGFRVVLSSQH